MRSSGTDVPKSEVLAALSRALDLTEGQPLGHAMRSCLIGMRLGRERGLSEQQLTSLYYALLLKDAGCSSNASRMAALFGSDDRLIKPELKIMDWDDRIGVILETWRNTGRTESIWTRLNYFIGIAREENITKAIIAARCERGAEIARRLGFGDETAEAIRSLDEHWNGNGYPDGLRGDAIPLLSRILSIAQTVEVFVARDSVTEALRILQERRTRWFDPTLVDQVLQWRHDTSWWLAIRGPDIADMVAREEPARAAQRGDSVDLEIVAEAFADIVDAKSPFTYRHSTNVAHYAASIGDVLGFDHTLLRNTRLAGLLHDLGKLGVSSLVLNKRGTLTPAERTTIVPHPLHTWEILSPVAAFAPFARQAALHHERLDGSGYPWGLRAEELDSMARVVAVADVYDALTSARPYRVALGARDAMDLLAQNQRAKLDPVVLDALSSVIERNAGESPTVAQPS